nr:phospholipase-like protein [Tanacetum cinerariifolium]
IESHFILDLLYPSTNLNGGQVLGLERNGGVVEKLKFSNEFCHLSGEFYDELNHDFLELFESAICKSVGTQLDVDTEEVFDALEEEERLLLKEDRLIEEEKRVRLEEQNTLMIEEESTLEVKKSAKTLTYDIVINSISVKMVTVTMWNGVIGTSIQGTAYRDVCQKFKTHLMYLIRKELIKMWRPVIDLEAGDDNNVDSVTNPFVLY